MIASHLDFKVLKQTVSIRQVLAAKGLSERFKKQGDRLIGPCPIHGGDSPSAFVVSLEKNLWYCFSECQTGGDVIDLVRRLDRLSYTETAERLASLASLPPVAEHYQGLYRSKKQQPKEERPFRPYTRCLGLDPRSVFLKQKEITVDTARIFETGAYYGRGFLEECIGVRLHDLSGNPIGYAGRRLDSEQAVAYGKWKLPPGLPKGLILYGFHRVSNLSGRPLCLVEGPWGVMRLYQIGVPAVALLGLYLSAAQRQLLANAANLIIMLDGDSNGRRASSKLMRDLADIADAKIVNLPDYCDPDDLSDLQLKCLLGDYFLV
jgi:DNA primase